MRFTKFLKLKKPRYDEPSDIRLINHNMNIIDEAIADVYSETGAAKVGYNKDKSGLCANNVQDAIDELYDNHIRFHPLLPNLYHGLAGYPLALTIECNYGAGISGAGNSPAGGAESVQLRNNITYLDRDRISISVGKKYNTVKSVTKISDKEYIVLFDDSTLSLLIVLYTIDGMSGTGGSGSGTAPDPEYVTTDAEIDAMLEQILG